MNIPNALTLFRLFLVPVFVLVFFSNIQNNLIISVIIFLCAGFTDILDGYIARKYNLITKWGMVIDPLADKLMLVTVLTCLVIKSYIPLWILIIIAVKELSMVAAGIILYNRNIVIPSNEFGKITTIMFYISIFALTVNKTLGRYLIYLSVLGALITFINYLLIYLNGISSERI
ncbi:CDP-diacylglycerol--glycerol-3-phosphate 3-phosphatidyltransferase [Clostridium sp.]|uniref:CDP-diacylglycerol--glycerol-3-phosphate 3-phosphatidyltransferase n=1 Tax=Clostridium sp. TaxID=1506 RepID=UPI002FDD74DF